MRKVLTIVKKELLRFFTDRRMLLSLVLPGIVLYLVYSLMGNVMGSALGTGKDYVYKVGINSSTSITQMVLDSSEFNYRLIDGLSEVDGQKKVKNKELDIYILTSPGKTVEGGETLPSVEIWYDSTSTSSSAIYGKVYQIISSIAVEVKPIFYVNAFAPSYDTASKEDASIMILTMLFPFLILVFLFSGSMAVSSESIAGEKERGTIATMLVTPVKRSHIALGKVIALSITSLASATVSFISVMLSIPNLMKGAGEAVDINLSMYGVSEYLSIFLVMIFTVMLFTVILSIISTIAKSVKEASSYAVPVMVLVMVVGLSGMFIKGNSPWLCLIPIYNTVSCINSILSLSVNPLCIVFTIISNTALITVGIIVLAKLFSSERVMFNT